MNTRGPTETQTSQGTTNMNIVVSQKRRGDRKGKGRGSAAAPGDTLQGRHYRGENLEFWRLYCNVLA